MLDIAGRFKPLLRLLSVVRSRALKGRGVLKDDCLKKLSDDDIIMKNLHFYCIETTHTTDELPIPTLPSMPPL
jgi:hypothetical protein